MPEHRGDGAQGAACGEAFNSLFEMPRISAVNLTGRFGAAFQFSI